MKKITINHIFFCDKKLTKHKKYQLFTQIQKSDKLFVLKY